jgi:DNA polymerase III subunit delta'
MLSSLLGQPTARATLERALRTGKAHHAYRFEGPRGVGKETAALLFAQAMLCTASPGLGCEECSACRRASSLSPTSPHVPRHPDIILIGRGVYPPTLLGGASEATGISVEQIRRILLPRLGMPPHESQALVVIIRDAEDLTIAAANALLKTLEEPGRGVHFLLLTSRPAQLLDTVLSRSLAVRFGLLPDDAMKILLERENLPADLISVAQGSLDKARALGEPDAKSARDEFLKALDAALGQADTEAALRFADGRPDARGDLLDLLGHVASTFAARARASGAQLAAMESWAERHRVVLRSVRQIEANGSPALVLESMVTALIAA